jgi:hypothetical protein
LTQTITYTTLTTLINDSTVTAAQAEAIIDHAINKINIYMPTANVLTNLSGTSGSMTGTYTSAQAGGIIDVAVIVYNNIYINSGAQSTSTGVGGLQYSSSGSSTSGSLIDDVAKEVARQLKTAAADPPIYVGNSPLPTS